jgi:hypothetical protein
VEKEVVGKYPVLADFNSTFIKTKRASHFFFGCPLN